MKNKNIKKLTAFLLSGAMLATGLAGAMPPFTQVLLPHNRSPHPTA